jgi:hypothetical protein
MTSLRRYILTAAAISAALAACASPTAPTSDRMGTVPSQPNTDGAYQGGMGRTPADSAR